MALAAGALALIPAVGAATVWCLLVWATFEVIRRRHARCA